MNLLSNAGLVRKIAFWLVVATQVSILLAFVGVREYRLETGTEVVLQTVPVDPRSLLQGDYAILRYEIGELPQHLRDAERGRTVYVLIEDRGEVWSAVRHELFVPPTRAGQLFIKGTVGSDGRLDFGIGTYFVPEGTGRVVERANDVKVVVSIDNSGSAAIKDVFVDGLPFREALAARPTPTPALEPKPTRKVEP